MNLQSHHDLYTIAENDIHLNNVPNSYQTLVNKHVSLIWPTKCLYDPTYYIGRLYDSNTLMQYGLTYLKSINNKIRKPRMVTAYVTPRSQNKPKTNFIENLQVQPTVALTDRNRTHGPSCTTIDGIRNSQKF